LPPRVLFVHNRSTRFVQIDLALLQEDYVVTEWDQSLANVASLTRAICDSDLVFGWFASKHTFMPTLLARCMRRPTVLVVGGYDTANMPNIGYGHQRGGPRRWVSQWIMQHTDRLLPYSLFARDEAIHNVGVNAERTELIYLGLPAPPRPDQAKERLVITVGDVMQDTLQRKGLVAFIRAAALSPDVPFVLIGEWRDRSIDYLRDIAPANVSFTGRLTPEELYSYMTRASVYVQASQHEAFALAAAEAMLHLCVPVVTRAGALPELVGDAGIYAASTEPEPLAAAIRDALDTPLDLGHRARERIVCNFPLELRRHGLKRVIESVLRKTEISVA
jgi:glycosyltransferase involved in cell wall biosynthesis